jgi:hypothetical protein
MWSECKDWRSFVQSNIWWLEGKFDDRHPISNCKRSELDTDKNWTEFLIHICDRLDAVCFNSQLGSVGTFSLGNDRSSGEDQRPYVAILLPAKNVRIIKFMYQWIKRKRSLIMEIYCRNVVRKLTTNTMPKFTDRSVTRSGMAYDNQSDYELMVMVKGTPRFNLTRYTTIDNKKIYITNTPKTCDMKSELDIAFDWSPLAKDKYKKEDFAVIYFASVFYGGENAFIYEMKEFLSTFVIDK